MKIGEIVFCNLKILHNKRIYYLKNLVYKKVNGTFYRKRILDVLKIKTPVLVMNVDIIERLGFENIGDGNAVKKAINY